VIVLVGAGLCVLVYFSPAFFNREEPQPPLNRLSTGGTSVVRIILDNRWRTNYRKEAGVVVDFEDAGSTEGLARMIDGKYAVAFTHAPMTEEQKKAAREQRGEVVHIPVILCAVVPIYNVAELKGKEPLQFTGEVLADIFLGKIKKWNDPALQALNKDAKLPDREIKVVHRKDSSGTTLIFAEYLYEASDAWKKEMGKPRSQLEWKVGDPQLRSHGVATHVYTTEDSIGYVDLLHTIGDLALDYGAVQNKDKSQFIHVKAENMTAAAQGMISEIPEDLTFHLTNRPGKESYPICGAVWAVCYRDQPASEQKKVAEFLHWVTHEGQEFAKDMSYAPLPKDLVKRVEAKLETIKTVQ
jgi:phosphate transport system substrate-binding protein